MKQKYNINNVINDTNDNANNNIYNKNKITSEAI